MVKTIGTNNDEFINGEIEKIKPSCSSCGCKNLFFADNDIACSQYILIKYTKELDLTQKKITIMPVTAYICGNCGFVMLYSTAVLKSKGIT